ncbi:hypothetical protein M2371_004301 [Buttiauxella sp. BIGb0471]|uniref:hypothetical protein n=1 Tax=Buttiauxella sp. BIGb0471 TaxID=2940597 RepID=UPI00216941F2|nr:hypothetical protein [Buttiauxella sp. BIGb0471]MCS3605047.1 hypothetical protein [Buttiauxella sp. BIGb0471]
MASQQSALLSNLATHGLNAAIAAGRLSLTEPTPPQDVNDCNSHEDEKGYMFTEIGGRPAVVNWQNVGWGELRVSVWFDFDVDKHPQINLTGNSKETFTGARPLAKNQHYPKFVGAFVAFWLERRTGVYIQTRDGQPGAIATIESYIRRRSLPDLEALPQAVPNGYKLYGKFRM